MWMGKGRGWCIDSRNSGLGMLGALNVLEIARHVFIFSSAASASGRPCRSIKTSRAVHRSHPRTSAPSHAMLSLSALCIAQLVFEVYIFPNAHVRSSRVKSHAYDLPGRTRSRYMNPPPSSRSNSKAAQHTLHDRARHVSFFTLPSLLLSTYPISQPILV